MMEESVARAICISLGQNPDAAVFSIGSGDHMWHAHRAHARAAIDAVFAHLREPSGDVLQAGNRAWLDGENEKAIFAAMLTAAQGEGS